jgi:hypothetical protein
MVDFNNLFDKKDENKDPIPVYDSKKKVTNTVIKDLNLLIEDKPNQGQFVVI